MNKFPSEISAWKNDVARRLVRLRGEVDGIMINLPMIPDPEIGMPFNGPLSPVPFVFPPTDRSGGTPNTAGSVNTGGTPNTTNTGGTVYTAGGCVGARYMNFTITGFSGCGVDTGTFKIANSGLSGGVCTWNTAGTGRWYMIHDTTTDDIQLIYSTGGGGILSYSTTGVPPGPGSSIVLNLNTNTAGCSPVPPTVTVTGSDV